MAFNISSLSAAMQDYTNGYGMQMVAKLIAEGQTSKIVTVRTDIPSAVSIPINSSTIYLQAGSCGWQASGVTSIGSMILSVTPISYLDQLCLQTLQATQLQWLSSNPSDGDDLNFADYFMAEKLANVDYQNELLLWQGSVASGVGNLSLMNGYIEQLVNTSYSSSTISTSGYTGITYANVVGLFDYMRQSVPTAIKTQKDLTLFIGTDSFDLWVQAWIATNNYMFDATGDNSSYKIRVPGYNVTIVGTVGLDGINPITNTKVAVLTTAKNLYIGTDLFDELNKARCWFSEDFNEVRVAVMYKYGCNIMFPSFVVIHHT